MKVILDNVDLGYKYLTSLPDLSDVQIKSFNSSASFACNHNNLTSLQGAPKVVQGVFTCSNNKLTSMKGAPIKVYSSINCMLNNLTTLEGFPQFVGGVIAISYNRQLISFKYLPTRINNTLYCSGCNFKSLEGFPKRIDGNLWFRDNPIEFSKEVIEAVCNVQGVIML